MNKKILIGIITAAVVILIVTLAYAMTRPVNNTTTDTTDQPVATEDTSEAPATDSSNTPEASASTITYTDTGFNPSPLTIKKGTVVTITNNSSMELTFASAVHPTHQDNPELNIDAISPGNSGTVTITKAGTWGYHNHDHANHFGRIIVTE